MTRHRSTAYVKGIADRGRAWKPDPITDQFRFVVRMAYACHARGVDYDVAWQVGAVASATITAAGSIPLPKPLPKPPKLRPVADWKPTIWDAAYRLEAYHDVTQNRHCPGVVIAHSCGLSLVHPSDSGELGVTASGEMDDIRQQWFIIHAASGRGFGLVLPFKRAAAALLMAASCPVDWTRDVPTLEANPEFRRAGNAVVAAYGTPNQKDAAKRRLERAA